MYKRESMEPSWLPPGFRFHPTDEELINYYLMKKVLNSNFSVYAIVDVDVNQCEPWDFRGKAKLGEKEWYFFTLRDRKYPTGTRTNRATEAGYWKATGKDREIISSQSGCLVGMKKTLVFYRGRAPKGEKTNWIMHEYRLEGAASPLRYTKDEANKSEWVVCRIFQKKIGGTKSYLKDIIQDNLSNISEGLLSLSPLNESANQTAVEGDTDSIIQGDHVSSFSEDIDRLPFPRHQSYSLGWHNRGQSVNNLDSASKLCGSSTSSCLDKHTSNLQVDNASSSSNALLKLMKPPAQQGLDQPYSATCKIEHHAYADGSDNFQNGYCRLLDKSAWLQESMPCSDSQSLLDAKLPSVSPLLESFSEEIPPRIYRADVVSSTEDFDCLLAC